MTSFGFLCQIGYMNERMNIETYVLSVVRGDIQKIYKVGMINFKVLYSTGDFSIYMF